MVSDFLRWHPTKSQPKAWMIVGVERGCTVEISFPLFSLSWVEGLFDEEPRTYAEEEVDEEVIQGFRDDPEDGADDCCHGLLGG